MQMRKTSSNGMNFNVNCIFKITIKENVLQIIMDTTIQEVLTKPLNLISDLPESLKVWNNWNVITEHS